MTIFHSLKIRDVQRETRDAVSISFEIPAELREAYRFTQGQHLTLRHMLDGEECRRSYSICSAVGDTELRVAIKKIDGGKFSTHANENLKAGEMIEVMEPQGRFFTPLDPDHRKHYVAFAAGSGITPIISIIRSVLKAEPGSRVTLVYGNRRVSSILFLEQLEDLKNLYPARFNLLHILSREPQEADLLNGRITTQKCQELFDDVIDIKTVDEVFLCGPEQMIMAVRDFLTEEGFEKEHIHFELFITDAAIKAGNTPKVVEEPKGPLREVEVVLAGRTSKVEVAEEGQSILDAAYFQGLDVPFACKGGVCSTCRAKVLKGEVRMDLNYALEDDEVAEGYVLTCQSHPLTDDVVVDYDA
ncbi:MAG: phenylacetate-CoA oxygenase/reductase subunit PaaK [Alphaproteobacteria bacterium]|nr:MAG: phenylacetate-CoA oxygenase/reductase subunit PaaK [Alphaproteobacteria bacterium]